MSTHITTEMVRKVAALARLRLAPGEEERLVNDLEEILAYVDRLQSVATDNVHSYELPPQTVAELRADRSEPFVSRDLLLAPDRFSDGLLNTKGVFVKESDHGDS